MKKLILSAIAFAIATGGSAAVSAKMEQNAEVAAEKKVIFFKSIKNLQENVHKANQLKIERYEIKKQIVQKKDKLFDLHMKAKENGIKSNRSKKSTHRQEMKKFHQDLRALRKEAHETKKTIREAMKAKDAKLASEKMTQWLTINEKINKKLAQKSAKLDEIIAQHQ